MSNYDGSHLAQPRHEDRSHAACCRVNQNGLPLANLCAFLDQVARGHALQHGGSSGIVSDRGRKPDEMFGRYQPHARIGSKRTGAIGDAVADLEVIDARRWHR